MNTIETDINDFNDANRDIMDRTIDQIARITRIIPGFIKDRVTYSDEIRHFEPYDQLAERRNNFVNDVFVGSETAQTLSIFTRESHLPRRIIPDRRLQSRPVASDRRHNVLPRRKLADRRYNGSMAIGD